MKKVEDLIKTHLPMSETAFYILLSLQIPRHGYGISKFVAVLTEYKVKLGSGTIYGTLTKMQRDEMIEVYDDSGGKITYIISDIGKKVLNAEKERIERLYKNSIAEITLE